MFLEQWKAVRVHLGHEITNTQMLGHRISRKCRQVTQYTVDVLYKYLHALSSLKEEPQSSDLYFNYILANNCNEYSLFIL